MDMPSFINKPMKTFGQRHGQNWLFCNLAGIKSTSKREKPSQPGLSKGILTVHTDPPPINQTR